MIRYFDIAGQERDAAWVMGLYGPVFTQGHSDKYRIAKLREARGRPVLTVAIPGDTTQVKFFFFGYEVGMLVADSGARDAVTFPLPLSYTYKVAGQGSHWLWVDGLRLIGLGVPEGAQNWKHLDVVLEEKT